VVPGYRVSQTDPYPAAVEDAFCAAAWVHAAASQYSFDVTRVASFGLDAGGNLAAMVGTVDEPERFLTGCPHPVPEQPWVSGIAAMNGYYDVASTFANALNMTFPPYLKSYMQAEPEEAPERYAEASPITWIDGSEPPFALIFNQTPYLFRVKQITEAFAAELEAHGVPVKVADVPGACPMMLPMPSQVLASFSNCGGAPSLADYGILEAEAFFAELFNPSE
jgi:acetyl esterase/lipase